MNRKQLFLMVFGALFGHELAGSAMAQEARSVIVMESLPHHLQARLDRRSRTIFQGPTNVGLQAVVEQLKTWKPGSTLRVCFFGGPQDVRAKIAEIAIQWTDHGNLKFEFGNLNDPQTCDGVTFHHIRIGFAYQGYWSLVGRDSIIEAGPAEQSMNLAKFDYNPPAEPTFSTVVLHEFGHALGFHHEHQHPKIGCEKEFDWNALYQYLGDEPNNWSPERVDFNMRRLDNNGKYTTTQPDTNSIMLYKLPVWMFKKKEESICFIKSENHQLSDGDKSAMAGIYPVELSELNKMRAEKLSLLEKEIDKQQKTGLGRIVALNALNSIASFDISTGPDQGPGIMMVWQPSAGIPGTQFFPAPAPTNQ